MIWHPGFKLSPETVLQTQALAPPNLDFFPCAIVLNAVSTISVPLVSLAFVMLGKHTWFTFMRRPLDWSGASAAVPNEC